MITADHRHIMKVALFALDNIFDKWNKISCNELCMLYAKFIAAIRKYGVLNSLSTETYKTLHKTYVKNLYRSSNRKNIMQQLIKAIKRKEIIPVASKIIHRKTEGFGKILWNFNLNKIKQKVNLLKKSINSLHSNLIEGLLQMIPALDTFLDTSSQSSECDNFCIIVYDAIHLDNVALAENQVSESTDSIWYKKILLLLRLFQDLLKEPYDLAIFHWYDILSEESELYSCLQLYYSEEYNTIPIGSIIQKVHIISRFDKKNHFLLNQCMF
ncbi:zn-finger domain-containing protein [Gigaspora margarita]|uniref:Zn-finger domain-containing protein n=1 Tax=Gigaspora margarita TaxID=4874 RepID=A0A8H4AD82_GIGMA|nr:zn-finger domain-containing protein [Gigaspora margarita]